MARAPGERLRRRWAAAGPVRNGATETELSALEEDLRVVLPSDFRDYLAVVDGMERDQWVGNEIAFWQIAHIREDAREWGVFEPRVQGTLLPFGDFLINSHAYAIRVSSPDAPVFVVLDSRPVPALILQCADSFDEFVTRYEQDHKAIYGG